MEHRFYGHGEQTTDSSVESLASNGHRLRTGTKWLGEDEGKKDRQDAKLERDTCT